MYVGVHVRGGVGVRQIMNTNRNIRGCYFQSTSLDFIYNGHTSMKAFILP